MQVLTRLASEKISFHELYYWCDPNKRRFTVNAFVFKGIRGDPGEEGEPGQDGGRVCFVPFPFSTWDTFVTFFVFCFLLLASEKVFLSHGYMCFSNRFLVLGRDLKFYVHDHPRCFLRSMFFLTLWCFLSWKIVVWLTRMIVNLSLFFMHGI